MDDIEEIPMDMKVADLTVGQLAEVIHEVVGVTLAEMLEQLATSMSDEEGEVSEEFLAALEAEIMTEEEKPSNPPKDELTRRRQKRK